MGENCHLQPYHNLPGKIPWEMDRIENGNFVTPCPEKMYLPVQLVSN